MTSVELSACVGAPNCLEASLNSDEGTLTSSVQSRANQGVVEQDGSSCTEIYACLGDTCTAAALRKYTAVGGGKVEVTVTPRHQPDGTEI